jgi:hypothetical protein
MVVVVRESFQDTDYFLGKIVLSVASFEIPVIGLPPVLKEGEPIYLSIDIPNS